MKKITQTSIALSSILICFFAQSSFADIEWGGVFRFEGNFIKNSDLDNRGKELSYGLSHLVLRPKIVAGDGLTIYGQFDVLNDSSYPGSQFGQIWGSGMRGTGTAASSSSSADDSNVASGRQHAETLEVSQLYLTYSHEYGQLILGRAPLQFGLGMTYSAGRGLFDHWYDSSDLVGYKIVLGNFYFLPMVGKANEGYLHKNDDLNDYMIQFQYENPETDLQMGVFYQIRKGSDQSSDLPLSQIGGTGATQSGDVNTKTLNLYALRSSEHFRLGAEVAFQSGESGVLTSGGDKVTWSGFGIAGEFSYMPEASKWEWGVKAGTASGDDPSTDGKYEGFLFDRNYDVAMLMFNRPLGHADFLRSGVATGSVRDSDNVIDRADVEALSNVLYFAPSARYKFNERWGLDNALITGWLGTNPIAGSDTAKDLGYEWDISLNYTPRKGVMWVNGIGLLFPGTAWEGGSSYDNKMAFGLTSKAAISF